jgi:uncharacterized OB-fold protein
MTEFIAKQCASCEATFGHQPVVCRECLSDEFTHVSLGSVGTVYASTTIHVPPTTFVGDEPYMIGIIEIGKEESVRVTGRIKGLTDVDPGDELKYEGESDGIFYFSKV